MFDRFRGSLCYLPHWSYKHTRACSTSRILHVELLKKIPEMEQDTINQRLNFLVESLAQSARAFSEAIGESPTNTHNYISGGRKPAPDYLKSLLLHYRNINSYWLLTGEGEPFLTDKPESSITQTGNNNQSGTSNKQTIKGNKGTIQNNTGSHNTVTNNVKLESCQRDLATAQKEIEHLQVQLRMQETVLAAKEETITLLRASFNRPN